MSIFAGTMLDFHHFKLTNGLNVYLHPDKQAKQAAFNLIYNVGSRDENEEKTGFAHLFEHLMFGGSKNIPSFDTPLQRVGGENNAFTSPDITNYYITLPKENIETAFWLESDRMLSLSFNPEVLDVQRKVVIEEFKQRYLNQPYGDVWLKLRPLSYEQHPYKWATIGKDISHIENATMEDVQDFFFKFYRPNNANLVIAGDFELQEIQDLSQKWFGDIPSGKSVPKNFPKEPIQTSAREQKTSSKVPQSALYKTFHIPGRYENGYFSADLLSDWLGRGRSSILYTKLVQENPIFTKVSAYVTGSLDTGLLVINGMLSPGISLDSANAKLEELLYAPSNGLFSDVSFEKVQNQALSSHEFGEVELLSRAMSLAFAANAGDAQWCNSTGKEICKVTKEELLKTKESLIQPEMANTLFYEAKS